MVNSGSKTNHLEKEAIYISYFLLENPILLFQIIEKNLRLRAVKRLSIQLPQSFVKLPHSFFRKQ